MTISADYGHVRLRCEEGADLVAFVGKAFVRICRAFRNITQFVSASFLLAFEPAFVARSVCEQLFIPVTL